LSRNLEDVSSPYNAKISVRAWRCRNVKGQTTLAFSDHTTITYHQRASRKSVISFVLWATGLRDKGNECMAKRLANAKPTSFQVNKQNLNLLITW